jgi:hypothetical protein
MNKRIAFGAAVTAAGIFAVPSLAGADSTCTYNPAAKTATVQLANPTFGSPTIIRPTFGFGARSIDIADGNGGFSGCFAAGDTTKQATVLNTDKLVVNGTPGYEHVELNEHFLTFAPGATTEPSGRSGIEIALLTGAGGDDLSVVGTAFDDAISAYGTTLGGRVDLDNDGDHDVSISRPSRIALHGAGGNDRLSGVSVFGQISQLPLTLDGQEANDTLTGGRAGDLMLGGRGNDFAHAVNEGADVVSGGDDRDIAFVDPSDTVTTVEQTLVKVGKLGGSAKTIHGDAGSTLSLPLTWTHPKAWKNLRSVEAIMFDGAKRVGSVKLTPAGKVSAEGSIAIAEGASKVDHHGRTVTAKLAFEVAKSLEGQTLSVDIAATDRDGKRQVETAARSIRVNP